jgi:two-component sensor histidine kinase
LLPAHLAVPVSMAIHELTTNAVKYGALSVLGATLFVNWLEVGSELIINWREENVPNVVSPEETGFGSQLLTRVLPQQINARVRVEYLPSGLNTSLVIPITEMAPQ